MIERVNMTRYFFLDEILAYNSVGARRLAGFPTRSQDFL